MPEVMLPVTDAEQEFVFRCFYVPQFAIIEVGGATRLYGVPPFQVWEAAGYLLAHERTHLEMVVEATKAGFNTYSDDNWERPGKAADFADLPLPNLGWFLHPPGDRAWWGLRFEQWRVAAVEAFLYYIRMKCKDMVNQPRGLAKAAFLGTLEHYTASPASLIGEVIKSVKADRQARKLFYKNAYEPQEETDWREPELDTWLIEIWPLAMRHDWNYTDVWVVAKKKFGSIELLGHSDQVRERCRKLGLRRVRRGRSRAGQALGSRLPLAGLLAIFLESIGKHDNYWLLGQRNLADFSTASKAARKEPSP